MNLWPVFGALIILATFTGFVWLIATWPVIAAVFAVVVLIALLTEWRNARRPNPFGGAPDKPEPCPHCGQRIEHDDAVRSGHIDRPVDGRDYLVAVPALMHERCARERQAVEQ